MIGGATLLRHHPLQAPSVPSSTTPKLFHKPHNSSRTPSILRTRRPNNFSFRCFSSLSINHPDHEQPSLQLFHANSSAKAAAASIPTTPEFLQTSKSPFSNLDFLYRKLTQVITPLEVCKWSALISVSVFCVKRVVRLVLNPFFWVYFSWTWLFWPWVVAISLGVAGLYFGYKHSQGRASFWEQLVAVTSAITWLTLVPPAVSNGFLEGWPIGFFFIYHYFFFFNVSVRKRLYGDFYMRPHDEKWDVKMPLHYKLGFALLVFAAHFVAACEATPLHLVRGGWRNAIVWPLVMAVFFMQYNAVFYLSKYSEKVVVPRSVVQYGPYRLVRHPAYASTMYLFALYFAALRAPLAGLGITAICLWYYDQKAKLEEELMVNNFGEAYEMYRSKVKHKFIPFVY